MWNDEPSRRSADGFWDEETTHTDLREGGLSGQIPISVFLRLISAIALSIFARFSSI